jgi:hypothetical protein
MPIFFAAVRLAGMMNLKAIINAEFTYNIYNNLFYAILHSW